MQDSLRLEHPPLKPLVLFDVDGTLLLTGGAGMRAMQHAAARLFGGEFSWDGIEVSGHLDPLIFAEFASANGVGDAAAHHDSFRDLYLEALHEELVLGARAVRAMPGIHETIGTLRSRGDTTLGLLTGNYTRAIPIKLGSIGIDPAWFEVTAFGDEADSRPALVKLAMDKYARRSNQRVDPRKVVIVGDTPRDVECAHAHGCVAFAVATGSFSVEDLRAAGAEVAVPDLRDATPLLDLVTDLCSAGR